MDIVKFAALSVTNLSSENNLPTFRLNAPVIIQAKVKKCEPTLVFIAMHSVLKIHVIEGQRSVRIASPFLPPHYTRPDDDWSIWSKRRQLGSDRHNFDIRLCALLHDKFLKI